MFTIHKKNLMKHKEIVSSDFKFRFFKDKTQSNNNQIHLL